MFTKIVCGTLIGIKGILVDVEVDVSDGFPTFGLVGMAGNTIKESKERVRTGIKNAGYQFPYKRIVVNLAPAHIPKHGVGFDLPIALGILACEGAFSVKLLKGWLVIGEIALDGSVRPVKGVLSLVDEAKSCGIHYCMVPKANMVEASLIDGVRIVGVSDIREAVTAIRSSKNEQNLEEIITTQSEEHQVSINEPIDQSILDFSQVRGQQQAKRGLEIAVSGMHHTMLTGPPGIGKTMLAKRVKTIMPQMVKEDQVELTKVYSAADKLDNTRVLIGDRPFRNPHHSITMASFIGGGSTGKPGEISLAHQGVLMLDEFPEFSREVIESLREPLESGCVLLSRSQNTFRFPAKFMLVASMNPCPCGYYPNQQKCQCLPRDIMKYQSKLSGPIMDRIDLYVEMHPVSFDKLRSDTCDESSQRILERVMKVHRIQEERYKDSDIGFNSQLGVSDIGRYCQCDSLAEQLLKKTYESLHLSSRSYHRLLKVARTIADMDESQVIATKHVAEAAQFRYVHGE